MSLVLAGLSAVTAVTDNTAYFAVGIFQEISIFKKDLFPDLQRRQLASSAFA